MTNSKKYIGGKKEGKGIIEEGKNNYDPEDESDYIPTPVEF